MLKIVDKHGGFIIQKVTTPRGKLIGYQAVIPGDASTRKEANSLAEIRAAVGRVIDHPVVATAGKHEYSQCQPGYRASARVSKKGG